MSRRIVVVVWAVLVGSAAVRAQEPAYREEMRFVEKLRSEGYSDLALDYLKRLQKSPSPELLRELPLELAKTQMEVAAQEPDSIKRLALYDQAKADFEKFLAANPGHPRAREAKLDVGRVLALRGKTQLSRALMQGSGREKEAEAVKARTYLAEAGKKLQEAVESAKDDSEKEQAQLEVALNLLDQAQSYDKYSAKEAVLTERAKKVQAALDILKPLATGDSKTPLYWKAKAWRGRGQYEIGEFGKARQELAQFRGLAGEGVRQAAEGERLARYFMMLLMQEKAEPEDVKQLGTLVKQGETWLKVYARFLNTPEGYGVRYLLAEEYLKRAIAPKSATKAADLNRARTLLRAIERTENDFTDRARQKKLTIVKLQGGFDKKITDLKTFEDSYIRAQYEIWQMGEDAKTAKDAEALEKKRQERLASILLALKHGLAQKDATPLTARGRPNIEYNNARTMLAFYSWQVADEAWREYTALQAKYTGAEAGGASKEEQNKLKAEVAAKRKEALGHYEEAIRVGEDFVRKNPKSSQATTAAVYALQAYFRVIAGRQAAGATPEDLKDLTGKMTALAAYMEKVWPTELAGNMARHLIGMRFYHDKDWPAAVKKLSAVTPAYPDFASAHYWLADALFHLHTAAAEQAKDAEAKSKEEPTPANKQAAAQAKAHADDLRRQAMTALAKVPPPAAADPSVNRMYVLGKLRLLRELYLDKKYPELEAQAKDLQPRVAGLRFNDDGKGDAAIREEFQKSLSQFPLLALMGTADAAFQTKKYAEVVKLLDPVVADLSKGGQPALKGNKRLGMALVSMDLRSNVQLGNVAATQAALKGLEALSDKGGEGTVPILAQLVGIIEQQLNGLRKKTDKKELESAIKNFSGILDTIVKRKDTKLTPEFLYLLGKAYANMDKHAEAAKMFEKVPPAKPGDAKGDRVYKGARLMTVAELRKTGNPEQIKKAREILDEIIGTKEKPGWGLRSLPALKERGLLFEAHKEYVRGAKHFNRLVTQLLKKASTDTALKEEYLDCYYHMVYCILKHGQEQDNKAQRAKFVRDAAAQASQLAKKWDDFGGEASKKRFLDLLEKEPEFKTVFDELSAAK